MREIAAVIFLAYVAALGVIAGWSAARALDRRDQNAARLGSRLAAIELRLSGHEEMSGT